MNHNQAKEITKTPFFFIIGRPRSGTTMLRTMLDAHPNVLIPLEFSNLIHLQYKYAKTNFWTKENLEEIYKDFINTYAVKQWNIDKEDLYKNLLSCTGEHKFEKIVKIIYSHYQSSFTKKEMLIIGDKSPINSLYIKKLNQISFNKAKYIYLTRDPRDNIASMKKFSIFSPSTAILANYWKQSAKQYYQLKKIDADRFIHVKYEDLLTQTEEELKKICIFLDIPFKKEILDYSKQKQNYSDDFVKQWQDKLFSAPDKSNIALWKKNMSDKEIRKIDYYCGKYLNKTGYEVKFNSFNFFYHIAQLPSFLILRYQNTNRKIFDILPYSLKKKISSRKFILSRSIYSFFKKQKST
jgi:Sulfotransferase family